MAEVAALFKQFIYRDLAFVFGGFIVLLSLTYAFHGCIPNGWQIAWKEFPTIVLIVFAAYVVGYAVQDIGGVLRLTPTSRFKPRFPLKRLYKCFSQVSWQDPTYPNVREFEFEIHMGRREIPEDVLQALERIRSLKVISMCVGGCLAVSALIFAVRLVLTHSSVVSHVTAFAWLQSLAVPCLARSFATDLVISIVSFLLALLLICLGRIKGMQEMQFYQSIYEANFPTRAREGPSIAAPGN